jgi:adenylate cyclase
MTEGTQRRLAAIVSADVVGYARLMGRDEAGTLRRLNAHRSELIDGLIEKHGGRIVKTMGDGLLLEFASVVAAVECCVAVQEGMAARNADAGEDAIRFRIGVHLGDVIVEGDDIFGDGVNIAARLQEIGEAGGVVILSNAHDSVHGRIEAGFVDGGEQDLKNIARPVRVWRWSGDSGRTAVPSNGAPLPLPDKSSIAVLPFDNMSGDPEQEYFADGVTEDIITALSKFHSFLVIARHSTFTYKGRAVNVGDVGRELGVRYVVEGSIRKAGNRVRVTAQLIEAAGGNHLWAERYDRDLEDIFALQDEISETIVGAVEQEIGSVERSRATRKRPDSLEAWELLQRGLHHVWQMNREGLEAGADLLRQSIAKDASFAQAHSQLAFTLLHQVFLGTTDDAGRTLSDAEIHTTEALKYDNGDSLAHEMFARILSVQHRHDEAVTEAKRAVQFNPNSASANMALAFVCMSANRSAEALDPIDRAIRISPKDPRLFTHLLTKGFLLGEVGRLDEGLELIRQATSMPHGDYRPALMLGRFASEAGFIEEPQKAAERVMELNPDFTLKLFETKLQANFHPDVMQRIIHYLSRLDLPKE